MVQKNQMKLRMGTKDINLQKKVHKQEYKVKTALSGMKLLKEVRNFKKGKKLLKWGYKATKKGPK